MCRRKIPLILMFTSALLLPPSLPGQEPSHKADSEILTSGSGETTLSPQRAVLRIGIASRAATAAGASSHNARVTKAVLDTLVRAGFRRDSLQTIAFGVGPNYDYDKGNKLIDYEATATIRVTVRDLSRIGRVIDQALAAGATDIGNVGYESDSLEIGRRQALAEALSKARDDARALAVAAGGSIGRMLEVSARDTYFPALDAFAASGFAEARQASAPIISPRDVVVRVAVQARWEFIPNR
ncbi:MAG: hypothetical protein DMD58_11210 [Gemmatimonadetes bacterium]|nr:MAG: hypothetical protein DMD58_11210 [Gemmatimonadota bacterium]